MVTFILHNSNGNYINNYILIYFRPNVFVLRLLSKDYSRKVFYSHEKGTASAICSLWNSMFQGESTKQVRSRKDKLDLCHNFVCFVKTLREVISLSIQLRKSGNRLLCYLNLLREIKFIYFDSNFMPFKACYVIGKGYNKDTFIL